MNPQKKCLVLDLDNTLWGGVVGEDGLNGLQLGMNGLGASFLAFQQVILDLWQRGIILAINSRNNESDALRVFREHPEMLLKEEHFAAKRINWNDKAANLKELAREINIGLDSLVFLDDDPVNRALVRSLVPEVETPELPADPRDYAKFLLQLPHFQSAAITDEDKMRGNYYVTERLRREAETGHQSKEEFLSASGLELWLHWDDPLHAARVAQLTEKTNQFNFAKRPYTEAEISNLIKDPNYRVVYARVADRYGDYGITAVAIVDVNPERWHISSLLLSCRVLGRGVEQAFVSAIAKAAQAAGTTLITTNFTPSEKNRPAADFLASAFASERGQYRLKLPLTKPTWITMS
jgi:FkbH-like protein